MPPPKKKGDFYQHIFLCSFFLWGLVSKKGNKGGTPLDSHDIKSRTNLVLFYVFFWLDPKSPNNKICCSNLEAAGALPHLLGAGNRLLETSGAKGREVWMGLATGLKAVEAKLMEGLFNTHLTFPVFGKSALSLSKTAG